MIKLSLFITIQNLWSILEDKWMWTRESAPENLRQPLGCESCATHWIVWILSEICFRGIGTVVTPRFRGWRTFFVSLRCLVEHPLEDVSLCGVIRCVWGGCERRGYMVYCLLVLGLSFWPFLGSGLAVWGGFKEWPGGSGRAVRGGTVGVVYLR
jgi:hypothetical protein